MDPFQKSSQLQNPQNDTSQIQEELTHVNQEMYKKNLELAEKNKILSLLRQIDSIILSTVTDIQQVAQQVVNKVVDETDFIKALTTFMIDKNSNSLLQLAMSQTEETRKSELELNRAIQGIKIRLDDENNIVVKAVSQKKMLLTHNLTDVFTPHFTKEESSRIQQIIQSDTSYIYPLIIRGDVIGAMVISVAGLEKSLPYYKIDLIDRIPGIIAISIDNALLYQSIQKANERLKEVDMLKDEFVSLASHELRTPMTVIKSYVWMLLYGSMGELSEKQKPSLQSTLSSTEGLIKLVNDMLNISRIESGRITIEPAPTDIDKLVSTVVGELETRASEVGIHLLYSPPQEKLIVKADIERIREVLINLLGNSLKFTSEGGTVTVTVAPSGNDFAVVKIKDTGRGISEVDMLKLFKKFNMVGNSHLTKDRGQGTGLGLYLSKSLIELHGGKIWAQSEGRGKGSIFSFTLPINQQSTNQQLPKESNEKSYSEIAGGSSKDTNLPPALNPRG